VVDRETRCILSWDVVAHRTSEVMQACLDRAPKARQYYSDAFPVYENLYYGAPFELRNDKKETYSVEAVNADLMHYLKRLARKSRCFSRCPQALRCALKIFVFCYNQRQLTKRDYPSYDYNLTDFLV
jgi:IS1 family transposase